jgi:hypothetical protein
VKVTNLEKFDFTIAGATIPKCGSAIIEKSLIDKAIKTSKSIKEAIIYNKIKIEDEDVVEDVQVKEKKRRAK